MSKLPLKITAALAISALAFAHAGAREGVTPGFEISTFAAPSLGNDFDGHFGVGLSAALSATYAFEDSKYDEVLVGQFEGLYLHSGGTNDIGGPSHRETLDAGFGFLNFGLGMRRDWWEAEVFVGAGFGGGSLSGDTTAKDLALDTAFQVKPRFTWHFAKHWSAFAEYRYLRTSSVVGSWFDTNGDRALSMHAVGLGVGYNF